MAELKYQKPGANAARLCAELTAALGDVLEGVAQNGDEIAVCLRSGADYDAEAIEGIVSQHDGKQDELRAREETRQLAAEKVAETDFDALRAEIQEIRDPQTAALFGKLFQIVNRLAAMQGMTPLVDLQAQQASNVK